MMDSETQRGLGKSPGKLIGCKIEGGCSFGFFAFCCARVFLQYFIINKYPSTGSLHRKNTIAIVTFDGMGK